jgi:RNAse (barnase) inhibitor barstar
LIRDLFNSPFKKCFWVTGLYALLMTALLWQSNSCDTSITIPVWSAIACLKPNELGDTLAGLFAPLAFFWLVAAVYIQSLELRAQREELADTREEIKLNRGVASEHAEAAKLTSKAMEAQTRVLEQGAKKQDMAECDAQFAAIISEIEDRMSSLGNVFLFEVKHGQKSQSMSIFEFSTQTDKSVNWKALRNYGKQWAINEKNEHWRNVFENLAIQQYYRIELDRLEGLLTKGINLLPSLSEVAKQMSSKIDFQEAFNSFSLIWSACKRLKTLDD